MVHGRPEPVCSQARNGQPKSTHSQQNAANVYAAGTISHSASSCIRDTFDKFPEEPTFHRKPSGPSPLCYRKSNWWLIMSGICLRRLQNIALSR